MTPQDIFQAITQAKTRHNQLVILTGGDENSRRASLAKASSRWSWSTINVGLTFSQRILELASHERPQQAAATFDDLVSESAGDVLLLERIQVLFERSLNIDPLKLLATASRRRVLVVNWPGEQPEGQSATTLSYAVPTHPEYHCYKLANHPDLVLLHAAPVQ